MVELPLAPLPSYTRRAQRRRHPAVARPATLCGDAPKGQEPLRVDVARGWKSPEDIAVIYRKIAKYNRNIMGIIITLSMNGPHKYTAHERWGAKIAPVPDHSKELERSRRNHNHPKTTKGGNRTNHHPEPATRSIDETTLQAAEPTKAQINPSHPR